MSSSTWACSNCKLENTPDVTVCNGCATITSSTIRVVAERKDTSDSSDSPAIVTVIGTVPSTTTALPVIPFTSESKSMVDRVMDSTSRALEIPGKAFSSVGGIISSSCDRVIESTVSVGGKTIGVISYVAGSINNMVTQTVSNTKTALDSALDNAIHCQDCGAGVVIGISRLECKGNFGACKKIFCHKCVKELKMKHFCSKHCYPQVINDILEKNRVIRLAEMEKGKNAYLTAAIKPCFSFKERPKKDEKEDTIWGKICRLDLNNSLFSVNDMAVDLVKVVIASNPTYGLSLRAVDSVYRYGYKILYKKLGGHISTLIDETTMIIVKKIYEVMTFISEPQGNAPPSKGSKRILAVAATMKANESYQEMLKAIYYLSLTHKVEARKSGKLLGNVGVVQRRCDVDLLDILGDNLSIAQWLYTTSASLHAEIGSENLSNAKEEKNVMASEGDEGRHDAIATAAAPVVILEDGDDFKANPDSSKETKRNKKQSNSNKSVTPIYLKEKIWNWYLERIVSNQGWSIIFAKQEPTIFQSVDGNDWACPAFAVAARDVPEKELVVSIRGSRNNVDWLINVRDDPKEFTYNNLQVKGFVHSGMHDGVLGILDNFMCRPIITEFAKLGYKIRICGHSLGAGSGFILAAEVLKHFLLEDICTIENARDKIACVGFATPPVFSKPLGEFFAEKLGWMSVVNKHDVIPRLSRHSAIKIIKDVKDFIKPAKNFYTLDESEVKTFLARTGQIKDDATPRGSPNPNYDAPGSTVDEGDDIVGGGGGEEAQLEDIMVCPGKLIYIYRSDVGYEISEVTQDHPTFTNLKLHLDDMVEDHYLSNYWHAIRGCRYNYPEPRKSPPSALPRPANIDNSKCSSFSDLDGETLGASSENSPEFGFSKARELPIDVKCCICEKNTTWPWRLHGFSTVANVTYNCFICHRDCCVVCAPAGDKDLPMEGVTDKMREPLPDYRISAPTRGSFRPERVCTHCYLNSYYI